MDAGALIASSLAVKEESEVNAIKKACELTNKIFSKFLKDQIINIIDNEKARGGNRGKTRFSNRLIVVFSNIYRKLSIRN